ncbi:hypothetical protein HID58_017302 [Brassica napus]|uniref:TF-B3 domain-containing protein n=1 Tax=Brassica napus TaxID=3708 RepID=A0ABQ8D6S0_BRANA|nr:hypothetical protein HID58_017302 [Brassica napus]
MQKGPESRNESPINRGSDPFIFTPEKFTKRSLFSSSSPEKETETAEIMASSTQAREVHHRKEEDALDEERELIDLNKEAKHEDDDKIVASETREAKKQKVEQEVKDANQEDERRGGMTRTTTPRSLTQEEAKAKEDDARASRMLASTSNDLVRPGLDINDYKFQQLLGDESGRKESRFTVYGPDGKVHEIWLREKKRSFDLTIGWWTFVEQYGLKECCDFVTVWMFRHSVTRRICLAVDTTRFAFRKQTMASSTQDEEEVHHRKEEDALAKEPDLDLNKEAKHEDDDKIVASESETREAKKQKVEQEVKDADQEDESRGATTMVPSTTTPRSLTQEEAKAKEDEDDSEQTLSLAEQCSRPIQKQLTTSDVKQNKLSQSGLSLSNSQVRKKFQQLLEESGKNERRFSVYGPDGKVSKRISQAAFEDSD